MSSDRDQGDMRQFLINLRRPMPLREKVWSVVRSYVRRARRLDTCCGMPGAPGC